MTPSLIAGFVVVSALITREVVRLSRVRHRWTTRYDVVIAIITVCWIALAISRALTLRAGGS